ncbi:hypothetical protein [Mycolicibacterium helvum]|uniref:Uncharacterized protein n=1 Tax=Mycolicibacterium helvum TaxID=1534349 RepID=A0A7I7SZW2_9MYCO|nr:hypothetical protein [Mycolicibacterium helvum]BBY62190.1 hypothetical protein MHEL_04330 [Mycolicibacterium helvum]
MNTRSIDGAHQVTYWTGLGVELPEELTNAIAVFEAIRYTEVSYQPAFAIEDATPENVEELIFNLAEQLAVRASQAGGGWSPLDAAKRHALEEAARKVNKVALPAVPEIIKQLTPEFDEHAAAYIAAIEQLPEEISPETLLEAGPDAVTAYGDAKREAAYLDKISGWVASTSALAGITETTIRILRPSTALDLIKIDAAHQTPADPVVAAIDPVLFTAARRGVEFAINTLREARDLRDSLAVSPSSFRR